MQHLNIAKGVFRQEYKGSEEWVQGVALSHSRNTIIYICRNKSTDLYCGCERVSYMSRDIECWFHRDPRVHARSHTQLWSNPSKHTVTRALLDSVSPSGEDREQRWGGGGKDPPLGTWQQPSVKKDNEKEREIIKPNSLAFIQYLQMWKSTEKMPVCGRTDNQVYKEMCEVCSCGESAV